MTIFEADWICPVTAPAFRDAVMAVNAGRITGVGSTVDDAAGAERIRFPGCAIIPGFVNAHAHLELTVLRGFLENLSFFPWLRELVRAKSLLTRGDFLNSARLGCVEALAAGVTTVGEVMDVGVSWDAMLETGLQGIAYQEVFGPADSMVGESMSKLQERIRRYRAQETPMQRIGISPHAPYTVSQKLFEAVRDYAGREGLRQTVHIAESPDECRFVRDGDGPFAEFHKERGIAVTPLGMSPIEYLHGMGMLKPEMLLIHAIELSDRDLGILEVTHPAVVHCPKSNAKLGHGMARVEEMLGSGLSVGLGSDSVASNNVVDMFEEMRSAVFQQRTRTRRIDAMDAASAFRMATLGGAECLGFQEQIGSLEAGKRADFVVVDLNDPALQPVYDPIEAMVYSASRRNVRATYIAGKELNFDTSDLIREASSIARRLKVWEPRDTGRRRLLDRR